MNRKRIFLTVLLLTISVSAFAVGTQTRTFVSSTGSDGGLCPPTAPCRTFAYALTQTASGGQIMAVDTAGYGAVTIAQSVTIVAVPGAVASIAASGSVAADVIINAGISDSVSLSNIVFDSTGTADGIDFNSGLALHVEHCTFAHFSGGHGIYVSRSAASDSAGVFVEESVFRDSIYGVWASSVGTGALFNVVIENSQFKNLANGFVGLDNSKSTVRNSLFASSGSYAVIGEAATAGLTSEILLDHCVISNGNIGVAAGSGSGTAKIRVAFSSIIDNSNGIKLYAGGTVDGLQQGTSGTNTVEGNTSGNDFTTHYTAK